MKKIFGIFLMLLFTTTITPGQSVSQKSNLPDGLLNFFVGNWTGRGEFANGKKISANLSFELSLDSTWLVSKHTDILPNKYKAISMWGVDAVSEQFVAYTFDNFRGNRKFVSNGWKNGKLILTTQEYYPQRGLMFQHFIYKKLSDNSFKMTYEISSDGISWTLGDYLIFKKN
jgi:hypothetical protein